MSIELFVDHNGDISGPYSPSEVKRMARDGEIATHDMIRKGIEGNPVRADNVKGLFTPPSTELAKMPQETEPAEPERNIAGEILSKTWEGLVATGKVTANIVTAGVSKLRTQPTTSLPDTLVPYEPNEIASRPPQFVSPTVVRPTDLADCPFCGEEIKAVAKKCKHCGEILDVVLRASAQPQVYSASQAQPVINIVNTNTANASVQSGGRGTKRWSPFIAVCLSLLIPGLGQ